MNQTILNQTIITDRSRQLTAQECLRERYWQYEHNARGIVKNKTFVPLATGSATHIGLQRLLENTSIDDAVGETLEYYSKEVSSRGFDGNVDQEYLINEQLALTEALLRGWAIIRLPLFKKVYNPIELEREAPALMLNENVKMLIRPDGVLENLETGFYEVLSFKTTGIYGKDRDRLNAIDVQGISETWAAGEVYGRERIGSVLMEFLVTGPRKAHKDALEDSERASILDFSEDEAEVGLLPFDDRIQYSPLIRAWRTPEGSFAWKTRTVDPQDSEKNLTLARSFNPNFGKRSTAAVKLEKWLPEYVPVWKSMSIKEWIEGLAAQAFWPYTENALTPLFFSRKYQRDSWETEEWKAEAGAMESRIRVDRDKIIKLNALGLIKESEKELYKSFPKNRKACIKGKYSCQYYDICFNGLTNPVESDRFILRNSNHPEEGFNE